MGLEDQGRIKEVVEAQGSEDTLVLLGAGDAEAAELYAETVVNGDPTYAGPLTGVALRLPVYFITEPGLKDLIPPDVYQEHVALMEMVMPAEEICVRVAKIRQAVE